LLAAPMGPALEAALSAQYELIGPLTPPFESSVAGLSSDVLRRVRAIVGIGSVAMGEAAIARMPALGLIACLGSGFEGVDVLAAKRRGIMVTHGPGTNSSSVADLAIGLLIECVRRIPSARARLYAGQWRGNASARQQPVRGLTGRKMGVYGLGAIGKRIATRATALEMEIGYHNRRRCPDVDYRYFDTLRTLAGWADVLVVAARADAGNRHSVNRDILSELGAAGYVVNIARGSIIDEASLIEALESGVIAGAGLDVFEHEPTIPPALLALSNVALTPHIGGNTTEAREALDALMLANLDAFFREQRVLTPVPETGSGQASKVISGA
jgi:lactate dehydrogenase-like 2-hydroxyacid dehydrogenase